MGEVFGGVAYRIPREYEQSESAIDFIQGDVGMAHTHGGFIKDNDNFSGKDLGTTQNGEKYQIKNHNENWRSFLFTPDGSGKKQNLVTGESKVIFRDMPRDFKDPDTRKNKTKVFSNTETRLLPLYPNASAEGYGERKLP